MKNHLILKSCSSCSAESLSKPDVGIWLHIIFSCSVLPWENLTHSDMELNREIFSLPIYHAYLE